MLELPEGFDFRSYVPEEINNDPELKEVFDKIQEKDLPSLLKTHVHLQKKLGNSVTLPGKDSKPEDMAAFKGKLAEAGIMEIAPEDYEVAAPENAQAIGWSEEVLGEFKGLAKELGLTQAQVEKLVEFDNKRMGAAATGLQEGQEAQMVALKESWKEDFDKNKELAARAAEAIFKQDSEAWELMERSGLNNRAPFLRIMAAVGGFMQEDPNLLPDRSSPAGDSELKWALEVMGNPDHPDHKKWKSGDPEMSAKVRQAFVGKYGTDPHQNIIRAGTQ